MSKVANSSRPEAAKEDPKSPVWPSLAAHASPYLGLVLVVGLFSLLIWLRFGPDGLERFLSLSNFKLITVHAAIPAAVALGMTVIMISGGIDLSVGYVVSLVTVTMMLSYRWAAEQPIFAGVASLCAISAGLMTGLACGWSNGMLITRLKVVPFVATLGMMGVARGLAQYLTKGSPIKFPGTAQPPRWVSWLGSIEPQPSWLQVGPAVWSVLVLALLVAVMLRYSVLGRYCFALGSNEATARLCGINVELTKVLLYAFAGVLTGWAGILQLARSGSGFHDVAAGLELDVIAAVVIGGGSLAGGEGTVNGTLIGALMITVLGNGCGKLNLAMEFRYIIIGLIIVVVSGVNSWRQRRNRE
jgi:ribose transport system permease protein